MKKVRIAILMILFSLSTSFPSFAMNVFEDFSQTYGGFGCPGYYWGLDGGSSTETAMVEDGKLIVTAKGDSSWYFDAWIDCSDPNTYTYYPTSGTSDYFDEFSTSIDTYWLDGEANRYGIYVCMQGNYNNIPSIWFWLWGDTNFTIGKYTGNWIYEEIVPWTFSGDIIHSKGEKNTLKITKKGNLFSFFINNHEVHSQEITGFPGGGVGISYADSMKIGFDNFRIIQDNRGMYVSSGRLYDANGNEFIMRGINHAHTWRRNETSSFANIKNTGANTIRVVLSSGDRWTRNDASDVANVIQLCKTNNLVCVLEVHDTTGFGEPEKAPGAVSLAQAVNYWKSIQSVLTGEEAYVIINIGNEPYGNINPGEWTDATINAISELRNAEFDHVIMVDAPDWGQDNSFIMKNNALTVFNRDPDQNTVFSIHMYGEFDTDSKINSYLEYFINNGLPIVIGEFGHKHPDGDPDEDAIMALAKAYGIGYIAWSWSGNTGGVEYLDLVNNFNPKSLTWWGCRLINGANGIRGTSKYCPNSVVMPWIPLLLLDDQ